MLHILYEMFGMKIRELKEREVLSTKIFGRAGGDGKVRV
jgi:hypothetical protein